MVRYMHKALASVPSTHTEELNGHHIIPSHLPGPVRITDNFPLNMKD